MITVIIVIMKACSLCREHKEDAGFYKANSRPDGLHSQCKRCCRKRQADYYTTQKGWFAHMFNNAQGNARTRRLKRGDQSGVFEITIDDIEDMWTEQKGLCYYTGVPMVALTKSDWQCSLERKDQKLGYIRSNVVLCCLECNSACQWTREKVKMLLVTHPDVEDFPSFAKANQTRAPPKPPGPRTCCDCGASEALDRLIRCRPCKNRLGRAKLQTPRGHMQSLLDGAKDSTKKRNNRKKRKRDLAFDIDLDFLVEQYAKQQGRCYYSDIPMTVGERDGRDWVMSVERLDTDVGYIKTNTVLICWEFQSTWTNWSREKVDIVRKTNRTV